MPRASLRWKNWIPDIKFRWHYNDHDLEGPDEILRSLSFFDKPPLLPYDENTKNNSKTMV